MIFFSVGLNLEIYGINFEDILQAKEAFLTGAGIVRAMPGPVFSVASYTSAIALKEKGLSLQIVGAVVGSLGIFLPSFFIVLFQP